MFCVCWDTISTPLSVEFIIILFHLLITSRLSEGIDLYKWNVYFVNNLDMAGLYTLQYILLSWVPMSAYTTENGPPEIIFKQF